MLVLVLVLVLSVMHRRFLFLVLSVVHIFLLESTAAGLGGRGWGMTGSSLVSLEAPGRKECLLSQGAQHGLPPPVMLEASYPGYLHRREAVYFDGEKIRFRCGFEDVDLGRKRLAFTPANEHRQHTHTFVANRAGYFEDLVNGKNSRVGEGGRGEGLDGLRRDPQVAATWLTNNLFGLLKDQLGGKEGETGEGHGQGGGDSDSEGELER